MCEPGGSCGASAPRKSTLLDRTKGRRQKEVAILRILFRLSNLSDTDLLILLVHIYTSQIRQEKRAALEEGLRRPPSQPLPSLRPLSQPPSLRYLWISPLPWSQGPYNDKSLIFSSQTTSDLPTMALAGWPPVARPEVPHVDSRTGVDQCCL